MEGEGKPQKRSEPAKEQVTAPDALTDPVVEGEVKDDQPDARKSFKKFLLINIGIVGAVFLVFIVLFLFMLPRTQDKSVSEENVRLRAEIERLQDAPARFGEKSKEQNRIESLIETLQPRLGPSIVELIARAVVKYAQAFDLPPELILSIINNTSRFEITAEGSHGAVGLMHISPRIYRDGLRKLGITDQEAYHIDNNIHLGCMILRDLHDQGRSTEVAIATMIGSESKVDDILVGFTNSMISAKKTADSGFPPIENELQGSAAVTPVHPSQ